MLCGRSIGIVLLILAVADLSNGTQLACSQCDYVVPLGINLVNWNNINVSPKNLICIEAGKRNGLRLQNFQDATVRNCGGLVDINSTIAGYGLHLMSARNVTLRGNGWDTYTYGIKIERGQMGLSISGGSTDVEVSNLEIFNSGFAGIMAKDDPNCARTYNRGNYTMYNLHIHHTYIHEAGGEGMYIGFSFYNGRDVSPCGIVYPHDIVGLRVYENRVENSGWDGIQVGCAVNDTEIHDNIVINSGIANVQFQTNGIQIGGGTTGKLYNNYIKTCKGNGIIALPLGGNDVFNNVIIDSEGLGLFFDDTSLPPPGSYFHFFSNTIINPKSDGIRIYSDTTVNKFYNNLIIGYPVGQLHVRYLNNACRDATVEAGNLYNTSIEYARFVDFANEKFQLRVDSPAVDSGEDISSFNAPFDIEYNPRPNGNGYDVGAYEYTVSQENEESSAFETRPGIIIALIFAAFFFF